MKSKEDKFEISIEELAAKFKEHIEEENNHRILFSAKFGIGKTYFLKKFFESNGSYEVFHLFPVNYQIATNEDIVQLLKHDILVELHSKEKSLFTGEEIRGFVKNMKLFSKFWSEREENIIDFAVKQVGFCVAETLKLGRNRDELIKVGEEYEKYREEIEKGNMKVLEDNKVELEEKGLKETDLVSMMVARGIGNVKRSSGKENVLIIDDLDRMEPDHVFRLLNVLSAYSDKDDGSRNKFGFDKIILVADIDNLRSAYKQKYGENVDFEGYMDKFYSIEVYEYKFEEMIKLRIKEILSKYIVQEGNENRKDAIIKAVGYITLILAMIINRSLDLKGEKKANTRAVIKGMYNDLGVFKERQLSLDMNDEIYYINLAVHLGIKIFGGEKRRMISILKGIRDDVKIKNVDGDGLIRNYEIFSFGLLEEVYSGKISDGTLGLDWEGYHISLKEKRIESIVHSPYKDVDQNVKRAKFFLDLLIQYIEDK